MTEEEIIKRLRALFFINDSGHLEWGYIEGVTLNELDVELEREILKRHPSRMNSD